VETKWIDTRQDLPRPFVSVLVFMPGELPCPPVREGYLTPDGGWYSAGFYRDAAEVTHWMPLPDGPKIEEKEGEYGCTV
jgi:hypothetical protein